MGISLNHFEQIIDEVILDRGLSYYENGHVIDFELISDNEYEATVVGTEEYRVLLKLENDVVVEFSCNCPYDMGPICKHVVASMYYLKQGELYLYKQDKAKSVVQHLKEILDKASHKELKDFIQEQSENDKQFRNLFFSSFAHLSENESKEFYQRQVKSIINSASDRYGFIGWHEIQYLTKGIDSLIILAQKQFESKNLNNAFYICTTLLEEMIKVIEYADDSSGDIGGIIEIASEMLRDIASEELPKDFKDEFLNYCIVTFESEVFKGWDWHVGILDIASNLIDDEEKADVIIDCLDKANGEYEEEYAQTLKYKIVSQYKSEAELQQFIDKHIGNSSIRVAEIDKAVRNEDYDRAIKLSEDGIEYDKKDSPGLINKWYNWLLKIAQIKNDKAKIIEYARYLFIDNFYAQQDCYQIMKQEIEPDKWHDFLEEIIEEVASKQKWQSSALVREIYINEKWWDRLFLLLKQDVSLYTIESNEQYLSKDYSQQLVQLYSQELIEFVEVNVGRKHYQKACSYLRRMRKLGGTKEVEKLIKLFRAKYPQRPALMDELSRV